MEYNFNMLPLQNNLEHFGSLNYVYYMTGFKNEEESYLRNIYYCKDHLLNIEYIISIQHGSHCKKSWVNGSLNSVCYTTGFRNEEEEKYLRNITFCTDL